MKTRIACLSLLLAALLPATSQAWSREGHQLVGELAQRQLSDEAAAEVTRLLTADGQPEPTLAAIAAWADELRAENREHGNELGKLSERWHYVNFARDADCAFVPETVCPSGNCVADAIAAQQAILADRSRSDAERAQALKFVVHFVGDAHQPMHAGYGDDRGGNNFQLQLRTRTARDGVEGSNLHRVWDYHLLASAGLGRDAYAETLLRGPTPVIAPLAPMPDAARAWSVESCRLIVEHAVYPWPPNDPPRGRVLRDDYLDRHRPLAEERLRQAAARLAALLEEALAPAR
ncbi:S1/P1 nuclease [Arenimonas composti]|uniref:Endonuclease n=1 Tax=Arenimonas composti TR7-09 = DSM 18010 TaxID=1121013 RepID=A0A091BC76_9GAMM|nr:S1/P1 nuclease [Arenimonas composti]KFN49351.1 hypothetical protein P873_11300 [Arenimonas composti TR7-09 = DSM 18010]